MSFLSCGTARSLLTVRTYALWRRQLSILSGVQQGHAEQLTREYSIFSDFSKNVKGEIDRNPELKNGISDLEKAKEKALKHLATSASKLQDSTGSLYTRIGAVRQEAEATIRQVSAAVQEKVSEASEKVKESADGFRSRAEPGSSTEHHGAEGGAAEPGSSRQGGGEAGSVGGLLDGLARGFASVRSRVAGSVRPGAAVESVKQGYQFVRQELAGSGRQRKKVAKRREPAVPSASSAIVVGVKSGWEKRYEEWGEKVGRNPVYKRLRKAAQPILGRGQELADDIRNRWETSDSPVVQRLQDLNESLFGETPQALAMKAILARDPMFSLPEFLGEVGEDVRPVLLAYLEGNDAVLRATCRPEVVERCMAEKAALKAQGMVVENKVLHIADLELVQLKMLSSDPLIIVRFQTQQLFCMRDAKGGVVEGGPESIMTFFYLWAMQLTAPEDCPPGTLYEPTWQLREVQQIGMQTLI